MVLINDEKVKIPTSIQVESKSVYIQHNGIKICELFDGQIYKFIDDDDNVYIEVDFYSNCKSKVKISFFGFYEDTEKNTIFFKQQEIISNGEIYYYGI